MVSFWQLRDRSWSQRHLRGEYTESGWTDRGSRGPRVYELHEVDFSQSKLVMQTLNEQHHRANFFLLVRVPFFRVLELVAHKQTNVLAVSVVSVDIPTVVGHQFCHKESSDALFMDPAAGDRRLSLSYAYYVRNSRRTAKVQMHRLAS